MCCIETKTLSVALTVHTYISHALFAWRCHLPGWRSVCECVFVWGAWRYSLSSSHSFSFSLLHDLFLFAIIVFQHGCVTVWWWSHKILGTCNIFFNSSSAKTFAVRHNSSTVSSIRIELSWNSACILHVHSQQNQAYAGHFSNIHSVLNII